MNVIIIFTFPSQQPSIIRSLYISWYNLSHLNSSLNLPDFAFISVLKCMCLIWTCKRISMSCAQGVGVQRSYVSSETEIVFFCLCRIPGVVFMFKHKKHLLQHPLDKSILLTRWSSLSADCNNLGYRSHELLLYKPELVELSSSVQL